MKRFMMIVALAACGGGNTGPISESDAREGCQKICTRTEACSPSGEPTDACVAECTQDIGTWPRADAFDDLTDCISDQPCDADEDVCLAAIPRLPIHDEWEDACRAKILVCEEGGSSEAFCTLEGDDEVAIIRLIAEPIMEEMIACTNAADCTARFECLQAVFERNQIEF